jgi:hypothetical protein
LESSSARTADISGKVLEPGRLLQALSYRLVKDVRMTVRLGRRHHSRGTMTAVSNVRFNYNTVDILLEINVSSVAHTPLVWATEETLISNRISTVLYIHLRGISNTDVAYFKEIDHSIQHDSSRCGMCKKLGTLCTLAPAKAKSSYGGYIYSYDELDL